MIAERDLKALQARVEAALIQAAETEHTDSTLATVYANKSLGGLNTIKEPNDWAHRNYCGPGAISVALDAIWSLSSISAAGYSGGEFKIWWYPTSFISAARTNNVQCALNPIFY